MLSHRIVTRAFDTLLAAIVACVLLLVLIPASWGQIKRPPKIEGCATVRQLMFTFYSDSTFRDALPIEAREEAARISHSIGITIPSAEKVVFKFMRGNCHSLYALVGQPQCWVKRDFCLVMQPELPVLAPPSDADARLVQELERKSPRSRMPR